jgi:hypothetical protein
MNYNVNYEILSEQYVPNPSDFDIENVLYSYDNQSVFEFPHKIIDSIIPQELKMVKNSKKENSLYLLKAVTKNDEKNEKFKIRMMRNSIWKCVSQDEEIKEYNLVNVNPIPYKIVVTPSRSVHDILSNLKISENVNYYQEHVDGPLFRVYNVDEKWVVSTTSLIYADGHWLNYKTFIDLFNETCSEIGLELDQLDKSISYYFILNHPDYLQVIESSRHALYFKEARDKEFKIIDHEKVELPQCINRLEVHHDMVILEEKEFTKPSDLFTIVLNTGDSIRVSNWIYEELNNLKGNNHHIRNMIIHVLRQPHHKIELFVNSYPRYAENLNMTHHHIGFYCDMLFKKYMKKEIYELSYEYPLQKNLYYHIKQMYQLKKQAREQKKHILDIILDSNEKEQGRKDYEWKENYVRTYIMTCSNENISIIVSMMDKFTKEIPSLMESGCIEFNKENELFWFGHQNKL